MWLPPEEKLRRNQGIVNPWTLFFSVATSNNTPQIIARGPAEAFPGEIRLTPSTHPDTQKD